MDLQDPDVEDVDDLRHARPGSIYIDDEPDAIVEEGQARADRLGQRDRPRAGQARHHEPDRDLSVARGVAPEEVEREFEGQGYGAFKQAVGEAVAELLAPVRERYVELRADEAAPRARRSRAGAERAREIAVPTMAEVHSAMGWASASPGNNVRTPPSR